uniref:Uncharacterized protein n=1 Tax=Arundo donax TaxID=35708 RepID=A0A0A9AN10_ARUDO
MYSVCCVTVEMHERME